MARLWLLVVPLLACSPVRYSTEPGAPTLVVPARLAEGKAKPAASAAAPAASAIPPVASASAAPAPLAFSTAPDPTPLRMAEQVEYELELSDGKVNVVSVKPVKLAEPVVTPRRFGRYAIELSIGHELIDRLRFDFPGTAADDVQPGSKQSLSAPLTLSAHALARVTLRVPQSSRVRQALLVDRATGIASLLEWPLPSVPAVAPAPAPAPARSK